jgi:membrane protein implicated in regulation of membrane protease activity
MLKVVTNDEGELHALYTMGIILCLTPAMLLILSVLIEAVAPSSVDWSATFTLMSTSASGFVAIIYVSVRRFMKARRKPVYLNKGE